MPVLNFDMVLVVSGARHSGIMSQESVEKLTSAALHGEDLYVSSSSDSTKDARWEEQDG